MKNIICILVLFIFPFTGISQEKSKLNYDRIEHVSYMSLLGGNTIFHTYGYEFRYNPNKWMRIQGGGGLSMFFVDIFGVTKQITLSPDLSLQFGKNWLWGEIGFQSCFNLIEEHKDKSYSEKDYFLRKGISKLSPRLGFHFKLARRFEIGFNYEPVFQNIKEEIGAKNEFGFSMHFASIRLRFVMVSNKRRRELGKWQMTFKDEMKFEPYHIPIGKRLKKKFQDHKKKIEENKKGSKSVQRILDQREKHRIKKKARKANL